VLRLVLLLGLVFVVVTPTASAGTAAAKNVRGTTFPSQVEFAFVASPGERNELEVLVEGAAIVVRDRSVRPTPGNGCTSEGETVRCPLPPVGEDAARVVILDIQTGDADDVVHVPAPVAPGRRAGTVVIAAINAGGGSDMVRFDSVLHDMARGLMHGTVGGGPGDDVLIGARPMTRSTGVRVVTPSGAVQAPTNSAVTLPAPVRIGSPR